MKFNDWIELRMEGEAARQINSEPMRVVGDGPPLSKAAFGTLGQIKHGEYKSKNFDRYSFKTNEQKTKDYAEKMKTAISNSVLIGSEALAGYYGNDAIIKALDDYLTELSNLGIKL